MTFLYVDTALLGMRPLYQGGSNRQFYHLVTTRTQETRRPKLFGSPRKHVRRGRAVVTPLDGV